MKISEILVEPQHLGWLPWAVQYFFFIGIAAGCTLLAFIVAMKKWDLKLELALMAVATVGAVVGPIALMADLHQPSRAWEFYIYGAFDSSWMAWGGLFLPLFSAGVIGHFVFLLRKISKNQPLPRWLSIIHFGKINNDIALNIFRGVSAIGMGLIFLYTCMEVYIVASRPLWHQPYYFSIMIASAMTSSVLIGQFVYRYFTDNQSPKLFKGILFVSLLITGGSVIGVYYYSPETQRDLLSLWEHGAIAPTLVAMWAVSLILSVTIDEKNRFFGLHLIWNLVFVWLLRWAVVVMVQNVAKYNALQNEYHIGWDMDGYPGFIAIGGLTLFVVLVLEAILNFFFQPAQTNAK